MMFLINAIFYFEIFYGGNEANKQNFITSLSIEFNRIHCQKTEKEKSVLYII